MCNEYLRRKGFQSYASEFSQLRRPIRFPLPHLAPNLEPQDRLRPTDQAPIFRTRDDGVELAMARSWLVPWWHRGKLKNMTAARTRFRATRCASHSWRFAQRDYLSGEKW